MTKSVDTSSDHMHVILTNKLHLLLYYIGTWESGGARAPPPPNILPSRLQYVQRRLLYITSHGMPHACGVNETNILRPDLLNVLLLEPGRSKFFHF